MQINPIIESKGGGLVDITSQVTPVAAYVKNMSVIRSGNVVGVCINTHTSQATGQILKIATGLPKTPISWYGVSLFASGRNSDGFARVNPDGSVDIYCGIDLASFGLSLTITYITNE